MPRPYIPSGAPEGRWSLQPIASVASCRTAITPPPPRESRSDEERHGSGALCGGRGQGVRTVLRCHSDIACSAARPKIIGVRVSDSSLRSQSVVKTTAAPRLHVGHRHAHLCRGPVAGSGIASTHVSGYYFTIIFSALPPATLMYSPDAGLATRRPCRS